MSDHFDTYNMVIFMDGELLWKSDPRETVDELMPLYEVMREIYQGFDCLIAILRNEIHIERITRS